MSDIKPMQLGRVRPLLSSESVDPSVSSEDYDWDGGGYAGEASVNDQWKQPCRAATTASITIATALNSGDTLDGVTLATGDRVLVKDQGTASQNGIYIVGTTPERAADMDDDDEVLGAVVYVIDGTTNGGTAWSVTNTAATVLDTDDIDWAAFGAGGGASFATPAIVLGTAAAAGAASTAIRSDSTIVAFDATAPTTQALGDSATTGSAAVAARRDHKHAMPAAAVTTSGLTMATARLLGRTTASTGAIEEITVGTGLSLSAGSLTATGSGGSITVEEVDGSPTDSAVTKIVFPNGTLGIASHVATYTPSGGSSDYVYTVSGGGAVSIPGVAVPDRVPASPSAYDDEFDTTDTSDPMTGWTTLGTLDSLNMNSDAKSHLHLKKSATGVFSLYGVYKTAPSTPFTVTAKVSDMAWTSNFQRSSIMLLEAGASNKIMEFGFLYNSATPNFGYGIWANRTSRSTWGGDRNLGGIAPYDIYIRLIVTSSSNVTTQFSRGGLIWQTVDGSVNPGFTIANVGLGITGHDNSVNADSYFDWIRFT